MTANEALLEAKKTLERAGIPEAEAKAKVIISHALDIGYSNVYTNIDVPAGALEHIKLMLGRCASGEPVEYITGRAYFRYLTLEVNPYVLIPRIETELVAGRAIELIKQNSYRTALDMCTGSGCIAISLATETAAAISAADISEEALAVAKSNAQLCGAADIRFTNSDMFGNLDESFDIIVCNPPYVSEEEYAALEESVKREPKLALLAGDGYDFYRRLACESAAFLNDGGALVLEIGAGQAREITELLLTGGFGGIECIKDYAGRDRIVCAFKG